MTAIATKIWLNDRAFVVRTLLRVLSGHHKALSAAFRWTDSPQGWDYWHDRHRGAVALSDDDRGYLIRLANEHDRARRL